MSSGGQNGTALSGVSSLRLQNASDATAQRRLQLTYQTYASATGANAFMGDLVNSSQAYLEFLQGLKESTTGTASGCTTCVGLPYQSTAVWTFRNRT